MSKENEIDKSSPKQARWSPIVNTRLWVWCLLGAFMLLYVLAGLAGLHYYRLTTTHLHLIEQSNQKLMQHVQYLSKTTNTLKQSLHKVSEHQMQQTVDIQRLTKQQHWDNEQAWSLTMIEQLIEMARLRLTIFYDTKTAIKLLEYADARAAELHHPSLLSLRDALAKDIAALQHQITIDVEGILAQLHQFSEQARRLPLKTRPQDTVHPALNDEAAQAPSTVISRFIQQLRQLIIIRHHEPKTTVAQWMNKHQLVSTLSIRYEQAALFLVNQQFVAFKTTLQQIQHDLGEIFDTRNIIVLQQMQTLMLWQKLNFVPKTQLATSIDTIKHLLRVKVKHQPGESNHD